MCLKGPSWPASMESPPAEMPANCRKPSIFEETPNGSLIWINVVYPFKYQMYAILPSFYYLHCPSHPELKLKSKYIRRYGYQHAKCEDPELIKGCFNRIQEIMLRYGIAEQNIYNMDETGFKMSVASTAKLSVVLKLEVAMLNQFNLEIGSG